jgi:hypothetical protein
MAPELQPQAREAMAALDADMRSLRHRISEVRRSLLAAVLTGLYLCHVGACQQEILRRSGRGQSQRLASAADAADRLVSAASLLPRAIPPPPPPRPSPPPNALNASGR